METALSLNGIAQIAEDISSTLTPTKLSADASFKASTTLNVVGNLAFSVQTSKIIAIGVGDKEAAWVFRKSDRPLVGNQHMIVTLLTPKSTVEIKTTVRVSATVSVFNFLPCTLERSIPVLVPLAEPGSVPN
jgi:hypothetical protein